MSYNDVITLVKTIETPDETGELITTTVRREVFAKRLSIGQKEFYEAMANGLQPEIKFELADSFDYEDEKTVEHNGKRYDVLRTFQKTHTSIEIVCQGGVNIGTA